MSQTVPLHTGHHVTLHEWQTDWSQRDERYELVDGTPTVSPTEHPDNLWAALQLSRTLLDVLEPRGDWRCFLGAALQLTSEPKLGIRHPDATLLRPGASRTNPLGVPGVELVAEVLSPGRRHIDLRDKRHEYAGAGIPRYLLLDRHAPQRRLTLLTDPVTGNYRSSVTGEQITITIDGHEIPVTAARLLD